MLKYVAIFPSKVGGGHTPLSLSCYTTLLLLLGAWLLVNSKFQGLGSYGSSRIKKVRGS